VAFSTLYLLPVSFHMQTVERERERERERIYYVPRSYDFFALILKRETWNLMVGWKVLSKKWHWVHRQRINPDEAKRLKKWNTIANFSEFFKGKRVANTTSILQDLGKDFLLITLGFGVNTAHFQQMEYGGWYLSSRLKREKPNSKTKLSLKWDQPRGN